ncbi:MAG: hypothetical protein IPN22_10980 [Bacteroidetes bacterium]|jgi:CRISPR/Cas system CMR-associated protein Cmr1 (group 7 of RAMP superfamily)|nr:hypothetical protein [Bacteroidota bacterium]
MKEQLSIAPKYTYMILSVFALIAIIGLSYLVNRSIKYDNELNLLRKSEIKGTIVALTDKGRGYCYIKIKNSENAVNQYSLSIAWEVKEYGIKIGDSVTKEANSDTMIFYKIRNTTYHKICEYKM